jgi:hypothetical protein
MITSMWNYLKWIYSKKNIKIEKIKKAHESYISTQFEYTTKPNNNSKIYVDTKWRPYTEYKKKLNSVNHFIHNVNGCKINDQYFVPCEDVSIFKIGDNCEIIKIFNNIVWIKMKNKYIYHVMNICKTLMYSVFAPFFVHILLCCNP